MSGQDVSKTEETTKTEEAKEEAHQPAENDAKEIHEAAVEAVALLAEEAGQQVADEGNAGGEPARDSIGKPAEESEDLGTVDVNDNPETEDEESQKETERATEHLEHEEDALVEDEGALLALGEEAKSIQEQVQEEELESHPLDELSDQQVIDLVQELETESRHLYLENQLFQSFLKENDPSLLDGLDEILGLCLARSSTSVVAGDKRPSNYLDKTTKYKLDSYTSITSIAEGKGPKINISQKTDMIMRAMEESQTSLEAFSKRCNITKRNLKAELEEFSIREAEIKEATEIFEYSVVTQGVDKLTQRIPAEKFIRYMEEWLKSAQLQIEKLRLRIATLKVQYKKVSQQLIQRQELGENVHAVDFDQLEIENKHFVEKIDQKNVHLIELKKMNGGANLILSTHKKYLQKQQEDCNKVSAQIEEKRRQIEVTEAECELAEDELNAEIEKYENCKKLKSQYSVPDVMEYVGLKDKLHEIKKSIKIWIRRKKIQDIALNTCLREMKNLTGRSEVDPMWFEEMQSASEESGSEEMLI